MTNSLLGSITKKRVLLLFVTWFFNSTIISQTISISDWNEQAQTNIGLLPKYGHAIKSADQISADNDFIKKSLASDTTHRKASNHLI